MYTIVFQYVTIVVDITIFLFVMYYFYKLHAKEVELDRRERKVDTEYHQVVDTALSKERKIVDDAVNEANEIIMDTQFLSGNAKKTLDQSLSKLVFEIQKDAVNTAQQLKQNYQGSLQQLTDKSLQDFQSVSKSMESEFQMLIKQYRDSLLPKMEHELEEYKKARLQQTEKMITQVVNTVSQEVLNKTIPLTDHKDLIIESLEKAKKTGLF